MKMFEPKIYLSLIIMVVFLIAPMTTKDVINSHLFVSLSIISATNVFRLISKPSISKIEDENLKGFSLSHDGSQRKIRMNY